MDRDLLWRRQDGVGFALNLVDSNVLEFFLVQTLTGHGAQGSQFVGDFWRRKPGGKVSAFHIPCLDLLVYGGPARKMLRLVSIVEEGVHFRLSAFLLQPIENLIDKSDGAGPIPTFIEEDEQRARLLGLIFR